MNGNGPRSPRPQSQSQSQPPEPQSPQPQPPQPQPPAPPRRVTLVLGTTAGGTGAHVRMLAAGLADRGVAVTVAGPASADAWLGFSAAQSVSFSTVEISARPRLVDLASILRLRRLLAGPRRGASQGGLAAAGAAAADSAAANASAMHDLDHVVDHVVHAHGLRAGALSLLALTLVHGGRRPRTVVTAHNAPPPAGGAPALIYRLLERVVARRADLVLCVSPDLEARMRAAGARRVSPAVIAAPVSPAPAASPSISPPVPAAGALALGMAEGRPVVLGVGRLAPQKGFGVLLQAAAAWRDLDPVPVIVIAGEGPLGGELRARAEALGVDAVFAGHRDDVPALLGAAAVFALPSRWEGQPLVLQEALRAATPVVASRAGGIPGLAGDAALLVPPGDARALAAAVRSVLTDPALAARLRTAAAARAAALPSAADAVDAALAAYAASGH